ncbi:hypothetical protein FSC37_22395 [Piscinibacter aquaticus]|uniref:Uncharacterized protein n=1 Tax=Piscinibacter aquaticus TaxID=392597 RepID=A0A5C6TQ35_9BURK|nr:hypothetical protein FSC37_22395 [Piscinibacter aquaticus]
MAVALRYMRQNGRPGTVKHRRRGWIFHLGAALIAIRPIGKAATNEVDAKRYAKLRTDAAEMTADELGKALNKARKSYAPSRRRWSLRSGARPRP